MFRHMMTSTALVAGLMMGAPLLAQDTPAAETVVATVGDTEITLGHMLSLRAGLPQQYDQVPPEALFKGVLDQLVQQTLLMQAYEGTPSLAAQMQLDNERRAILAADVADDVLNDALTDEALQEAYEARYSDAEPETEYKAAHILVETEEEAQKLIEEIEGGANFAALAQEHSTGPSGPSGGDLGWFGDGVMVPEFFDAVAALDEGGVSAPLQTQFGWHVIQLKETRVKERPELDAVRDELVGELRQAAFDAYIADLEAESSVARDAGEALDPALINQTDLLEN
ncbi:MAG: peptidylprolyl isomerase [Roseovarius sp.]|jgi:peptidyl-prolyl cis-trans isomerase C|uniref:peptidylprolyl isomerase n=1 Tax=Roseovarius sp. TaxID=1486281 RepID=UPI0032EF4919